MTALSDRIAAEHQATPNLVCACGYGWPIGAIPERYAQHLADVTERAVRDTIVRDIERLTPDGRRAQAFCAGMDRAARIAREGTADA